MKRVFKYKNKYLKYEPHKIIYKLKHCVDENDTYKDTWLCGYYYPRTCYTPILCENIEYWEDEDDEGYVDYEYFYGTDTVDTSVWPMDYVHYRNIKNIKFVDKFPREWQEWKGPANINGWWWAHHPACDYDSINTNHDY